MNYFQYLESNFVSQQIKQLTVKNGSSQIIGRSQNEAVLALMWVALKFTTAFYMFMLFTKYILVLTHILPAPPLASVLAAESLAAVSKDKELMANMMNNLGEEAQQGLKSGAA